MREVIEGQATDVTEVVENALSLAPSDMDASLAVQLSAAEIDQQIATARKWPRSIDNAVKSITQLATYDPETAQECIYNLPRGKGADAKVISGPSIRMAELIAQQWGNNRCDARVVHVDRKEKYIEAEGVYHDLETNTAVRTKVRRRISDKYGKIYNDDMIIVTGNAACSIALRNAILRGVPKPIWRRAYEKAIAVVRGDIQTLQARRGQLVEAFEALGVPAAQVYALAGVAGPHDVGLDQLVYLAGVYTAIRNNEVTAEDLLQERTAGTPQAAPKGLSSGFGDEAPKPDATTDGAGPKQVKGAEPKAGKARTKAEERQDQVKAERRAALDKAASLGEEAEEAALNGDGSLEEYLARAETDEEQTYVSNGWARGTAAREADAGDDAAAASTEEEDEADTTAPAGETYLIIGEGYGEDGRRPTYQDGKPFSTVTEKGAAKLTAYDLHAPELPAEETPAEVVEQEALENAERQQGDQVLAAEAEQQADPVDEAATEGKGAEAGQQSAEPNPFDLYDERLRDGAVYPDLIEALRELSVTQAWRDADEEARRMTRIDLIERYEDLVEGGMPAVNMTEDLQLFRCWIEKPGLTGPEIQKVWRDVIRSKAYGGLPEEQKDGLGAAVGAAKEVAG